jgi:hypothetical protein
VQGVADQYGSRGQAEFAGNAVGIALPTDQYQWGSHGTSRLVIENDYRYCLVDVTP